jgi:hypothetical protein
MNRENIQKVRDHIASLPPERFDVSRFFGLGSDELPEDAETAKAGQFVTNCGTTACVGGWTLAVLDPEHSIFGAPVRAAELLGIDRSEARELFYGGICVSAEQRQAVAVLDHLLATGEVDWSVTEQVAA